MVVACLAEPNEEAVVPVRRCSSRIKVLKSEEEARRARAGCPSTEHKKPKKRKVDDNVEVTVTDNDCTDHPASQSLNVNGNEKSAHVRVTETIRRFNQHYLHFVQGAEDDGKRSSKRPDLKAVSKMKSAKEVLNSERIGHIPGIDVGHQFFSRAEMVVVGFHIHWLNGIDCVGQSAGRKVVYRWHLNLRNGRLAKRISILNYDILPGST